MKASLRQRIVKSYPRYRRHLYKLPLFAAVLLVGVMGFIPFLVPRLAGAAQITARSLSIGSGVPSASTTYTFDFTTATSSFHLDGIKLIACTTAIGSYTGGTCTAPTGFSFASATFDSISGFTDTTSFTIDTSGSNDCVATSHPEVLCLKRTSSTNDTAGAKTLVIDAVTNPSTANSTVYVGITTYSSNAWTVAGRKDAGTVAAAVVQSLTVNATVAEILQFCAGSTTVNDATTSVGSCSGVSGTSVNIGTLDPTSINTSPVSSGGGNNSNGVLVMRTNAINGSAVYYDAIQDTGTSHLGALRILGSDCSTTPADCITSAGGTQTTFTAGTADFGMTIGGTNCGTASTYYTCVYASGSEHLVPSSNYVGATGSYGTGNGFAWVENGSSTQIASASSNNTVADEALILRFAATPSITTAFGSYQVKVDFTAVPTF